MSKFIKFLFILLLAQRVFLESAVAVDDPNFDTKTRILTIPRLTIDSAHFYTNVQIKLSADCKWKFLTRSESSLRVLEKASLFLIQDEWIGLSSLAPLKAHYMLERHTNQFSGGASFSVGGASGNPCKSVEDITIPVEVVQKFLQMLTRSPLEKGHYEPKITHTDDYPSIKITLQTDTGIVAFFTQSQGVGHVPWGVTFEKTTYVINSDIPAKALEILKPYLKKDERLESLSNGCRNSAK
ncbi:MAG: hypothetical protein DRR19_24160 [Candidatus Parabeggiatoa sp. nov. 1]|nr:MAG: hypothetical protein DRR19_24160 [Gammaproteobacteria bacterium]